MDTVSPGFVGELLYMAGLGEIWTIRVRLSFLPKLVLAYSALYRKCISYQKNTITTCKIFIKNSLFFMKINAER